MASFALHVSQKAPRTGKAPLPGNISPPCIQNELTLARFARHVSEKPCKSPSEDASREYLARKEPFLLHRPLESCTTRESCHSWVFRLGVAGGARGAGAAHAARARPPLCARRRGAFAGSSHAAPSCSPLTRTMLLLLRLPSRETCPLPTPPREARTFRGALCEVSAFASRRWVCLSPFTRCLCLVRSFRGGARC